VQYLHLRKALPWLMVALQLDQRRSSQAIGTSVRDAACYVLWSIIRSSAHGVILLFSQQLSQLLVSVSLFDREVQIRRAASAVFQEAVGRLDAFAEGIPILQHMNFATVTSTRKAFLDVCPALAWCVSEDAAAVLSESSFDTYRPSLVQHLSTHTLFHWDESIRQLAAGSLGRFPLGPSEADVLAQAIVGLSLPVKRHH
jgi:hypothetical protein